MRPSNSERKDSATAIEDPSQLRMDKLAIEAAPVRNEFDDFLKGLPRPAADPKITSERRMYTAKAPVVKEETVLSTEEEIGSSRKRSGFGLKFMGKISRKSVIQFERLTMPQVLMDWPQWHRQQRSKAIEDGKDLTAVLSSGLYTAVRLKYVDYIVELFENGAKDTARHGTEWTLLHHAIKYSDEQVLIMLLEKGVDPNMAVERTGSPLHYAAQHGNEKVMQILLEHNANPNIMDSIARPPLYFALRYLLATDHANKQTHPKWPFGKNETTRSTVCYQLRVGIRGVLLLLHHGAGTSSEADEHRWRSTIQSKLAMTQTRKLSDLISFLADPLAPRIFDAVVEFYVWIQHALKDSMREAARGSVSSAKPRSAGSSAKSVRFEEPKKPLSRQDQQKKKTADAERLELLLGIT